MSKSMTPQRVRDNFVQNLAENAYLNMCTTEEMNIVISALEKQIPKKPEQGTTNAFIYVCPNCGGPVGSLEVEEIWCDFCPKCGQAIDNALDWSDEE